MDHLGIGDSLKVPYYSGLKYDGCGFHQFPDRCGWELGDDQNWHRKNTASSPADSATDASDGNGLNNFLQAWLFFGLLDEVLGVGVKTSYLTEPNAYGIMEIDTKGLPELIQDWRERVLRNKSGSVGRLIRSQLALDEAFALVSRHCTASSNHEESQGQGWPINETLALSLLVLGETLSNAQNQIVKEAALEVSGWNNSQNIGWGYSSLVVRLMKDDGWCPHSTHMLQRILQQSSSGLLYAKRLGHPKSLRLRHDSCTYRGCKDRGHGPYRFKHWDTHDICRCQCVSVDLVELRHLLKSNKSPLLTYKKGDKIVSVVEKKPGMTYAILSHVFADGFGNPHENALPLCRLEYFMTAFGRMIYAGHQLRSEHAQGSPSVPMYFWIDTLAIPVTADDKALRSVAIKDMHKMYIDAAYTIVFDAGLMTQPRGRSYSETAFKITTSYWITRLWTLQEAYLSKRVIFYFEDMLQDLDELQMTYVDKLTSPVPLASQSFFKAILGPERAHFKSSGRVTVSPAFLQALWNALQWRSTSVSDHEAQAIATLLELDTSPFDTDVAFNAPLSTVAHSVGSEARMQKLLQQIARSSDEVIPEGLIFTSGPKLSARGFCWAPRSWLAAPDQGIRMLSEPQHGARLTPRGLEVTLPGFKLHDVFAAIGGERVDCSGGLTIPADRSLTEWIVIKGDCSALNSAAQCQKRYAVITESLPITVLPRPGLLLELGDRYGTTEHAEIVAHVTIHLEIDADRRLRLQEAFQDGVGAQFCGERISAQSNWCIDGPCLPRDMLAPPSAIRRMGEYSFALVARLANMNILG